MNMLILLGFLNEIATSVDTTSLQGELIGINSLRAVAQTKLREEL